MSGESAQLAKQGPGGKSCVMMEHPNPAGCNTVFACPLSVFVPRHFLCVMELCPKKGVWNFQALKTPAFIETGEFQTPFFGPHDQKPRAGSKRRRFGIVV
jgi:hypothetical protein